MSSETVDDKNISMPPKEYVHQKMAHKEGYLRDAKTQIELAETYLKDITGKYGEKDVFKACEKAIDYMDSFLQEDYNVTDLLTTYVEYCGAAISVLVSLKSKTLLTKSVELCERFGSKITEENSVEDKNDAILEIAQLLASLNSARCAHDSAIEYFELVKRVQGIQHRRNKSGITRAMIAQTNLSLAIEHIDKCDVEHYEKSMKYYIDAMVLLIEDCYKGKLRIEDSLYFDHSFKDAFDMDNLYIEIDGKSNLEEESQSVLHKEFSMFRSYVCDLRNKKSSHDLQDCVEGLIMYLKFLERIKELAGWRFEDVFFLQKKESCYLQISDLLLEMGEFYESKRYSDLAKQLFSSNI